MRRDKATELSNRVRAELDERLNLYVNATWSENLREEIRALAKEVLNKYLTPKQCKTMTAMVSMTTDGILDIRFVDHKGRIS